ncbi:MAG TPA: hypothetical protein VER96_10375 [Polyangiaceae bacterium]|nr:hypothetical protein [Polyangiaceae bacterium]
MTSGTRKERLCTVWNLETGFFVRAAEHAPAAQEPAFSARIVPDIDEVTQFFRVRVEVAEPLARTSEVWVIFLHADGRASAEARATKRAEASQRLMPLRAKLLATLPNATFCFIVDDREGSARVIEPEARPIELAAAVAVVKYSAAWDESNPILVSAGDAQYAVSVAYTEDRYLATVR